jgi:outer membrane receptor protein involved in Fe transport
VVLTAGGTGNQNLKAERARSYTFGGDWQPSLAPRLKITSTYFHIDYTGRISEPDPTLSAFLFSPQSFQDSFVTNPSTSQIAQVIQGALNTFNTTTADPNDPSALSKAVTILFDDRPQNIATSKVSGVDLATDYKFDSLLGVASIGQRATYILDSFSQTLSSSLQLGQVGFVFYPPRFKAQMYFGTEFAHLDWRMTMMYIGPSTNPSTIPVEHVSSWTTWNLSARYDLSKLLREEQGGTQISLTARNLFDRSPPFVAADITKNVSLTSPIGFDPRNANPIGRFISLELMKRW